MMLPDSMTTYDDFFKLDLQSVREHQLELVCFQYIVFKLELGQLYAQDIDMGRYITSLLVTNGTDLHAYCTHPCHNMACIMEGHSTTDSFT